jgi:hypothetical protein
MENPAAQNAMTKQMENVILAFRYSCDFGLACRSPASQLLKVKLSTACNGIMQNCRHIVIHFNV